MEHELHAGLAPSTFSPLPYSPASHSLQAQKVAAHLQKGAAAAGGDVFVWTKKIERELGQGKKVKELSTFKDKERKQERLVRSDI